MASPTGALHAAGINGIALDNAERARLAQLREHVRRDWLAAHALARVVVGRLAQVPPAAVRLEQRCDRCAGDHGRPHVLWPAGMSVSWSHTQGYVAAAASWGPVAVDVESTVAEEVCRTLSPRVLAREEATDDPTTFTGLWVRKECLVKLGVVDLDRLSSVRAGPSAPIWQQHGLSAHEWHADEWQGAVVGSEPMRIELGP